MSFIDMIGHCRSKAPVAVTSGGSRDRMREMRVRRRE